MIFSLKKFSILLILVLLLAQSQALVSDKFSVPIRFLGNNESIFSALDVFETDYNPLDFGVAMPNFNPPDVLRNALSNASLGHYSLSQYSASFGLPRLTRAIAKFYSKQLNRTLNPDKNVIITVGATQALFTTFQTHTTPGDEWILIEPYFSSYEPMIRAAYGVPKFVPLKQKKNATYQMSSRHWTLDSDELSRAFNNKTKGIVLNTPHNPTGKVFTKDELEVIANLTKKWNTLVVSDEVYEFLIYDQNKHVRIASLPGMFERTITIGSGGKAFTATGLKIGWAYGDAKILNNLKFIHHSIVGNAPTPIQEAFAVTMENEIEHFGTKESFLHEFRKAAESKRNYFINSLLNLGMNVTVPEGGYFITAKWTPLSRKINLQNETDNKMDVRFVKWMVKNVRVLPFPVSGYYSKNSTNVRQDSLRFCFIKTDESLQQANIQFGNWIRNKNNKNEK